MTWRKRQLISLVVPMLAAPTLLGACPSPDVMPLIGEDPEVSVLLGKPPADDPRSSPMAAARRLHQALVQLDTDTVWALLSAGTRQALDERGTASATSGRELIDESQLPGPGGTMRKVRFETIFFGPHLLDLKEVPGGGPDGPGAKRTIVAVSEDGAETRIQFVHEDDGWKLDQTAF